MNKIWSQSIGINIMVRDLKYAERSRLAQSALEISLANIISSVVYSRVWKESFVMEEHEMEAITK